MEKLKCVIVDDDSRSIQMLAGFCGQLSFVEVSGIFKSPKKFIDSLPSLDFDLCLVGLNMPEMNGLKVARKLDGKPIIFVAGDESMLKDAINMAPIDIILKPLKKDRLNAALSKAYRLLIDSNKIDDNNREYGVFKVFGVRGKTRIKLSDICHVRADVKDTRNKHFIMKDGKSYLVMDCPFEELLKMVPTLVRINKSDAVLAASVREYEYDSVTVEYPIEKGQVKQLTLTRSFSREFKRQLEAC
jgi:DNA-binding LytR/AlgR family response regulator